MQYATPRATAQAMSYGDLWHLIAATSFARSAGENTTPVLCVLQLTEQQLSLVSGTRGMASVFVWLVSGVWCGYGCAAIRCWCVGIGA